MEFEIVLIPKLAPHYNFWKDKKTGKIEWQPGEDIGPGKTYKSMDDPEIPDEIRKGLTKKDWVDENNRYYLDDKKVPKDIRDEANKKLVKGLGKQIVEGTIKLLEVLCHVH